MIIVNQKNRPYKKYLLGQTQIRKSGDLQKVCIADDLAKNIEGGLQRLTIYPLGKVLDLQHQDKLLEGHPLLDLQNQEGSYGYIDLPPYQIRKILRWQQAGDFVGLRNYSRKIGGVDNQISRIRSSKIVKHGIISPADMLWLRNVCEASHHYIKQANKDLASKADPVPVITKEKQLRPPGRLSRKARRQAEQEEALYGETEPIERSRRNK